MRIPEPHAAGVSRALAIVLLLALSACAAPRVAEPTSSFERCVNTVGHTQIYVSDRIKAASWCVENGNGGI